MKTRYSEDNDTHYIELRSGSVAVAVAVAVADTRDLDDDTLVDVDAAAQRHSITLEQAQSRAELATFSYQQIAA